MQHAATITFHDADSNDEATIVVRYDETRVGLCLSLSRNGDVEAFMSKADAAQLLEALELAVS